ncbi:hypothetical protein D9598_03465 [Roseomonas sp. KE0001]|nr:hypothetical protein [Roseomonas sp. KE0001]
MDVDPMRFAPGLLLLAAAALAPGLAQAQSWPNDTGPRGDLMTSTSSQFDRFWQAPAAGGSPALAPMPAPVPVLDWQPPPSPAAPPDRAAQPRRQTAVR